MSDTDLNEIKAGEYELVAVQWDEVLSKPGEPFQFRRHKKGDIVRLNADDARRLYAGGAVVRPGERQKAKAQLALANFRAALEALTPEQREAFLADAAPAGEQSTPPRKRTPRKATTAAGGAQPTTTGASTAPGGDESGDEVPFPTDGDTSAQLAWLVDADVDQVQAEVADKPELKATMLELERTRGEDARPAVVEALSAE